MRYLTSSAAAFGLLFLTGCPSGGLSTREGVGQGSGVYLTAMTSTTDVEGVPAGPAGPVKLPTRLGVAQVGEVAPPKVMMHKLEKSGRFTTVGAIPAVRGESYGYGGRQGNAELSAAKSHLQALRSIATAQGMDYLLVVGGTTDSTTESNPLSVLNLTIIGAFVVPGKETQAIMKASGALMEVKSGALVCISTAEQEGSRLSSAVSEDGDRMKLFKDMRDKVTAKLADAVITDVSSRAGLPSLAGK